MGESVHKDLAATEGFLASCKDVVEVHVWERGDRILARVVVTEASTVSGLDLKAACSKAIGQTLAPDYLLIERVKATGQLRAA